MVVIVLDNQRKKKTKEKKVKEGLRVRDRSFVNFKFYWKRWTVMECPTFKLQCDILKAQKYLQMTYSMSNYKDLRVFCVRKCACIKSVWWHNWQISLYNMWSYAIPGNSTVSHCNKSGPVFNHAVTICNHCATMTNSGMLTSPHTHVKWANSDECRRVSHVVNVTRGRKSAF